MVGDGLGTGDYFSHENGRRCAGIGVHGEIMPDAVILIVKVNGYIRTGRYGHRALVKGYVLGSQIDGNITRCRG